MKLTAAVVAKLARYRSCWLVTGGAGFIGSHLVESLLRLGQSVSTLDNLSTGHRTNLEQVESAVGAQAWNRHQFIHADRTDLSTCQEACRTADYVLHHAALGSVPRSMADPVEADAANITGFLNMLVAACDAKSSGSSTRLPARRTAIIPGCRRSRTRSGVRCFRMR
jgi:UDP-N-acetylglucosamine 4-epimerase